VIGIVALLGCGSPKGMGMQAKEKRKCTILVPDPGTQRPLKLKVFKF
jgi:hypothetical protein